MIKNVVFDIGGVLWKGNHSFVLKLVDLTDKEKEEVEEKYFKTWKNVDLGYETIENHFKNTKFSFNINEYDEYKLIHYYETRPYDNDILNLINDLKINGYKIYILSNNNKEAISYLMNEDLFDVDGAVISCYCHYAKPDKRIYEELFNKYNLNPSECYFIDDKRVNIEASKNLGMDGFVYKENIRKLREDLRKKGVNIDR